MHLIEDLDVAISQPGAAAMRCCPHAERASRLVKPPQSLLLAKRFHHSGAVIR